MRYALCPFVLGAVALSCTDMPSAPVDAPVAHDTASVRPAAPEASSVLTLASLQPHDTLTVRIDSEGCFHKNRFELTLVADATGTPWLSGSVMSMASPRLPGAQPRRELFKTRQVSRDQLIGLDQLLAYYRRGASASICTTSTALRLSLKRGGQVIADESYIDHSCSTSEQPGVMTFYELL